MARALMQVENMFIRNSVEAFIRIGLLWLLALWCFRIVQPFILVIIWAAIIAMALHPIYESLRARLNGKRAVAATVVTLACLALIIGPTVMLVGSLAEGAQTLAHHFQSEAIKVPTPPQRVMDWPLIGGPVYEIWLLASQNLQEALQKFVPQIRGAGTWLLGAAAGTGLMVLQFVAAIIISGIMMAYSGRTSATMGTIFSRLAGKSGERFASLAQGTVRGVARGILGVALIQALLAGIGMQVAGIAAAGLWALLVLILCVIQLGPALVLLPAAIYLFYTAPTLTAVLFLVWSIIVMALDNVLKPMLMGRGVDVPTLVIFLGAIGGFIALGIIGLFVGSILLVFGYQLVLSWLGIAHVGAAPEDRGAQSATA